MSRQSALMVKETIQDYINEEQKGNRFPISLNDTYEAIGYSRKDSAVRTLENSGMLDGQDVHRIVEMLESGKESIDYMMTIDCFKHFCMLAKTEIGYQVRQYFIDVEKAYRKMLTLNSLTGVMEQINHSQQEYGDIISELMTKIETDPDSISQKDLDAALIANRLGLAYNKRLKAFKLLVKPLPRGNEKTRISDKSSILALEVNGHPMCYRILNGQRVYDAKNLAKILKVSVDRIEHDLEIEERPYLSQKLFDDLTSKHGMSINKFY